MANRINGAINGAIRRSFNGSGGGIQSTDARFAAGWKNARRQYEELNYRGAKPSRYRSAQTSLGGSADAHYAHGLDLWRIREYARDFDRNDPNVGQLVDGALDNCLGSGLRVDPQTGDKAQNEDQRGRFEEWAGDKDQCDYLGDLTLDEMERLALRHTWIDGDAFAIKDARTGSLRLEEGDRVTSPDGATSEDIVHGIVRDAGGRVRGYLFSKLAPSDRKRGGRTERRDLVELPREAVIHVHPFRKRVTQSRGVSAFAPVFDQIGITSDGEFARLVKLQVSACIAGFFESEYPEGFNLGGSVTEPSALDDETDLEFGEFTPAMMGRLRRGEKFNGFAPRVTSADDLEFLEGVLRRVGLAIGTPLEVALLTAKNQSYSALRGILEQYKIRARVIQTRIGRLRRQVYLWKLREWVEAGIYPDRPSTYAHTIITPSWPYLDPYKDAQADAVRLERHLASPRQVWAEGGRDYDQGVREIASDRAALVLALHTEAVELVRQGVAGVTWRDLLSLGVTPEALAPLQIGGPPPAGGEQ